MIPAALQFYTVLHLSKHPFELLPTDAGQLDHGLCPDAGLPGLIVDEGQFSKVVSLSELPDSVALPFLLLLRDQLPLQNNIKLVAAVALLDDILPLLKLDLLENVDQVVPKLIQILHVVFREILQDVNFVDRPLD